MIKIGIQAVKTAKKSQKAFGMVMDLPTQLNLAEQTPGTYTPGYEYLHGNTAPVEEILEQQELAKAAAQNPERIVLFSNINDSLVSAFGPQAASEILDQIGQGLDDAINTVVLPVEKRWPRIRLSTPRR